MINTKFQSCMEACQECAVACSQCLDACLEEDNVKKMAECIRLDRDCANICHTSVAFMASNSQYNKS
ncbi:MAG: four-helix bundle copper-binding protein [Bacteroidetes bacterium]|nr:four-helix bundle copper-binding protein [Bacteroidota bacterium]